ncbi:hypothetical protein [Streptomyces sp. NPDC018693]
MTASTTIDGAAVRHVDVSRLVRHNPADTHHGEVTFRPPARA